MKKWLIIAVVIFLGVSFVSTFGNREESDKGEVTENPGFDSTAVMENFKPRTIFIPNNTQGWLETEDGKMIKNIRVGVGNIWKSDVEVDSDVMEERLTAGLFFYNKKSGEENTRRVYEEDQFEYEGYTILVKEVSNEGVRLVVQEEK